MSKRVRKDEKITNSDLSQLHFHLEMDMDVTCDASDYGIKAVLLHRYENGNMKPVVHASHFLITTGKKYS